MLDGRWRAVGGLGLLAVLGACARHPAVATGPGLPLRRVVVYRNGVGYFERAGHVDGDEVQFRVQQSEVGDFLATLAVMERGGSSVRSAAFPMPEDTPADAPPGPAARRAVRLALDGRGHDLDVGYTVETPIWRPSYRLVFDAAGQAQIQAWGIVQNLSGEDWTDVRLSLVAGSPVSFRSELATAVVPSRPVVTDRGAVIDAVPLGETTLAQEARQQMPPAVPSAQTTPTAGAFHASAPRPVTAGSAAGPRRGAGQAARTRSPGARYAVDGDVAGGEIVDGLRRDDADQPDYRGPQGQPVAPPPPPPTSAPRNLASLAALAAQGGTTRYDLPNTVTIPDRSATMVMLVSRDIPGAQTYLFAPDPGVPDSTSHPFHVARFENRTGALLERGPLAIFESGAFLGEGLLEPLPDGASASVPFALERGLAVDSATTWATEGARLVRIQHDAITIERYSVSRTTYHVRNGLDHAVRVMVRQTLGDGITLFEPPTGTEQANGAALVPVPVEGRGHTDSVVVARRAFAQSVDWSSDEAANAIRAYIHDGHPAPALATALETALTLRQQVADFTRQREGIAARQNDLTQNAEETRSNLLAIQRNARAADLRVQLTARLGRIATEVDQITRQLVELDTNLGERRVRLAETVRGIEIDTTVTAPVNPPAQATVPPPVTVPVHPPAPPPHHP